jgi:hypothetical protein
MALGWAGLGWAEYNPMSGALPAGLLFHSMNTLNCSITLPGPEEVF